MPKQPEKARLNLEIERDLLTLIHKLKDRIDAGSITGVVRLSLRLMEKIIEFQDAGSEIVVRSKNGKERVLEFFFEGR